MRRYNPGEIEPKWQQKWEADKTFHVTEDANKPKKYIIDMFPYPSGAAMHVGHVRNFTISDVLSQYHRQKGYNVLHTMGWDTFGLPAENYAIKTGTPPAETTKANIANFKHQLTSLGMSYDWSREISTSSPEYYKWTQWIFTKLFENDLAYQAENPQWWCPVDKTVLANEQVEAGKCWRCGNEVVKKSLKQWFFKTTAYADALLESIDDLDWPEKIKAMQRNWIGRSTGAEIEFRVCHPELDSGSSDIYRSYIMGVDDITSELESISVNISEKSDDNIFKVNIPDSKLEDYEKLISKKLKPGFWNEYIGDEVVFIFKDESGDVSRFVWDQQNEMKLLELCQKYAKSQFSGIKEMLAGNEWYKDWILNQVQDDNTGEVIRVFTTRPDTLFGATFMVLAPEHRLVEKITTEDQKAEVAKYIKQAQAKSDIERQETSREKTGVFTGAYAINPINNEKIPVWIADYVLTGYGTGAIMAVPAHDERDNEFAKKFDLPITPVIEPVTNTPKEGVEITDRGEAVIAVVINPKNKKLLTINWVKNKKDPTGQWAGNLFVGGGVEVDEDYIETAKREILEETGYKNVKFISATEAPIHHHYYSVPRESWRKAKITGLLFELIDEERVVQELEEYEKDQFAVEWVPIDQIETKLKHDDAHELVYDLLIKGECYHGEGVMVNSGQYNGMSSNEVREKIVADLSTKKVGEEKVNYKIRDWLISRQRYWGAPIPIIHCEKDGAVAVPEKDLPVVLPEVESYEPTGEGSVLKNVTDWVNTTCPKCGGPALRETDTMDGYACSSWYFLRYTDPLNSVQAWDPTKANYWLPIDYYCGGDHAVSHLLYSRFWMHFFADQGWIEKTHREPVGKLVYNGYILAHDGNKMSKSKGNVINPDDLIAQGYGADSLRLFEMFIAPYEQNTNWNTNGVPGTFRFLQRFWTVAQEFLENKSDGKESDVVSTVAHKAIKQVSLDLDRLSFNTAVSSLMEAVNSLYKIKAEHQFVGGSSWKFALESITQLLAPFAPHISEELWQQMGNKESVHIANWPVHDEKYLTSDTMKIVIQVNGKVRATIDISSDATQDNVLKAASENEKVAAQIGDNQVKKSIYVPKKLVNFVI